MLLFMWYIVWYIVLFGPTLSQSFHCDHYLMSLVDYLGLHPWTHAVAGYNISINWPSLAPNQATGYLSLLDRSSIRPKIKPNQAPISRKSVALGLANLLRLYGDASC